MSTKAKNPNWGGARPGSGPKKETLSVRQVKAILKEVEDRAEKEGKTIYGVLLDIIYGGSERNSMTAAKLIMDYTLIKLHEGGEADQALGPAVYLPEQKSRLKAIDGGKK